MIRIYVDISTSKYIYYYFFKSTGNQIRVILFFGIWIIGIFAIGFLGELPHISLLVLINDTEQNRAKRQQFSKAFDHVNSFKEESLWTYKARLPQLILCEVSEGRWNRGAGGHLALPPKKIWQTPKTAKMLVGLLQKSTSLIENGRFLCFIIGKEFSALPSKKIG